MSWQATSLEILLGPASLYLRPLDFWEWLPLAWEAVGPADLCLRLLARCQAAWCGVALASGERASPDPPSLAALPHASCQALLRALKGEHRSQAQEDELHRLRHYLDFAMDYPGVNCEACAQEHQGGESAPDCAACPMPPIPIQSQEAMELYALLAGLPPGMAAGLLPGLVANRDAAAQRLLLMRLALLHRRLDAPRLSGNNGL